MESTQREYMRHSGGRKQFLGVNVKHLSVARESGYQKAGCSV